MKRRPAYGPRARSRREWRAEIADARVDAAVALDAYIVARARGVPTSALGYLVALRTPWFVRLAIEERRCVPKTKVPKRYTAAWIFRGKTPRERGRREPKGRGDVFCLFCCVPLLTNVSARRRGIVAAGLIDYTDATRRHTTMCALQHLAGMRTYAAWGSVQWPDEMREEAA